MLQFRLPDFSGRWLAAGATLMLWALAAGSVLLWWLHLPRAADFSASAPSLAQAPTTLQVQGVLARALGHTTAQPMASDVQKRFSLLGVIASDSGQGSALLAVDDQPAMAFVQGQRVADGWRLESVHHAGVRLSSGQGLGSLELALPQKP